MKKPQKTLAKALKKIKKVVKSARPAAALAAKKTAPVKKKTVPVVTIKKGVAKKAAPAASKKSAPPAKVAAKAAKPTQPAKHDHKEKDPKKKVAVAAPAPSKSAPAKVAQEKAAEKPVKKAAAPAPEAPPKKVEKTAAPANEAEEKSAATTKVRKAARVETEEVSTAPEDDEIVLTDAEGRRYCRVKDCDQASTVEGYCRYHYLLFWKNIQARKKILSEGKLERYIEELTARYPDKYLELLRKDLRSEKDFMAAIQELEIDDSGVDSEYEDEAQSYLDEVRGMGSEAPEREEDF